MGKTISPNFLGCFWSDPFYTVTCIKSRTTSSNFGQIGPLATEFAALEHLKISHRLIMGKCCLHASSFIFYRLTIKVAGNQDRHKNSDEGQVRLLTLELLALEWRKFYTFEIEYLWGQLASLHQILCVASLGVGKSCIMFWGRLDHNSGVHGNRKPPLTCNGENGVSTFSQLLLTRSFLYLQITRTYIKFRTSSNFGQIGLLTTE